MSSNVRSIVMRALFEPDFHNLLVSKPEEAIKEYNLSQAEADALKNPTAALYKYLQPGLDTKNALQLLDDGGAPPPPPPTTVVVVIIVAITVFVAAASGEGFRRPIDRYVPLINAIHNSKGVDRMDLVKTLVNELTKEA